MDTFNELQFDIIDEDIFIPTVDQTENEIVKGADLFDLLETQSDFNLNEYLNSNIDY